MAHDTREVAEILRAHRFELVDDEGRVRVVLGPENRADSGVSLSLLSPAGERRVALAVDNDGADVVVQLGGNFAIVFGVNEPHSDAVDAYAYFHLCDQQGAPVLGWRVTDDGDLLVQPTR